MGTYGLMLTMDRQPPSTTAFGGVLLTPVIGSDASAWSGDAYVSALEMARPWPRGEWLPLVAEQCRRLFALPACWDGYGARQVNPDLLQRAWTFAKVVAQRVSVAPSVIPTVGGGVALEWHARGVDLEIEFKSTGELVLLEDEAGEVEGSLRALGDRVAAALSRL